MRKIIALVAVIALAFVPVAQAASFTITLSAAQVSAIQYAYSVAMDRGSYGTAQDWFAAQVSGGLIAQYQAAQAAASANAFCTKFKAAGRANQDSICTGLGLSTGCNPCQ